MKKAFLPLMMLAGLTVIPLEASANLSGIADALSSATRSSSVASNDYVQRDATVSCTAGNFRGTANVLYNLHRHGNNDFQIGWVTVQNYKIDKLNNQKGGNKANVNLKRAHLKTVKSSDSMKQDGNTYLLGLRSNEHTRVFKKYDNFYSSMTVEFIFDKSGSDPRCEATIPIYY